MPRIEEVFNTNELINYFKERTIVPMLGESLFPERKIQDIEFDMILGRGGLPVSASVHAYDTKTKLASRQAIEAGVASLALIKNQIKIAEKELIKINRPRSNSELDFVLAQLYKDAEKMTDSVKVRVEAMRMELLSTGKIKIEENGVKVTIDYGVPAGNKKSFNWSDIATAKPLDDVKTLVKAVKTQSGSTPARVLTSSSIIDTICSCVSVRKAIFGTNSDMIATLVDLNNILSRMQLPKFVAYDELYKVETAKGFDTKRYFPENVLSMFGASTLGETIYGLTAEEIKLIGDGKMDEATMLDNKIFVGTYTSTDPVGEFTKAAATALPSCPYADEIGIATITL